MKTIPKKEAKEGSLSSKYMKISTGDTPKILELSNYKA